MKLRIFALTASLLVSTGAVAVEDASSSGPITMVAGNEITTSDEIVSGSNWLALQCDQSGCNLTPAEVAVSDVPAERDGMEMTLHRWHFSTKSSVLTPEVDAWFRKDSAFGWLKAGPLLTYSSDEGPVRPKVEVLTKSIDIQFPDRTVTLMPLLDVANRRVRLQLREPTLRQMLDDLTSCLAAPSYLLWAGDLDGDGRPDYLIDYPRGASNTHTVLYLSSLAGPHQLVGSGAVFDSAVAFGDCDEGNLFGGQ